MKYSENNNGPHCSGLAGLVRLIKKEKKKKMTFSARSNVNGKGQTREVLETELYK